MPRTELTNAEKDVLKAEWKWSKKTAFSAPPGTYYIGDLCYALDDKFYDGVFGGHGYQDGYYEKNDTPSLFFAMAGTGGDGDFKASNGWRFCVDAGIIGIASKELCSKNDGGYFVTFKTPATCVFRNLTRGDGEIVIETEDDEFYLRIKGIDEYEDEENEDGDGENEDEDEE